MYKSVEKFLQYEIPEDGRLTDEQIEDSIAKWKKVIEYSIDNDLYYKGEDPYILSGQKSNGAIKGQSFKRNSDGMPVITYGNKFSTTAPDWRIPVPYAAKIVHTITGYMYKPGSITVSTEDTQLEDALKTATVTNQLKIKNSELGVDQSIYGVSFELVHTDGEDNAMPKLTKLPLKNTIPIYDYSIDKTLWAVIYFYVVDDVTHYTIYYKDAKVTFTKKDGNKSQEESIPLVLGEVPVVIYHNNKDDIGDFDRVKALIDAYDYLLSDNVNEFERFAQAYMVLVNYRVDNETLAKMKEEMVIQVDAEGAAKFLTKEINAEHVKTMLEILREEIHKQSHVVDFTSDKFGGALSGAAIDRLMIDMNNLSNTKQIYFEAGLMKRMRLLNKIIKNPNSEMPEIEINFTRNVPIDLNYYAQFLMNTNGIISKETRYKQVPFIDDPEAEMEKLAEEEPEDEPFQEDLDVDNR